MIETYNALTEMGWSMIVLIVLLIIVLVPSVVDGWNKLLGSLGLKKVKDLEREKIHGRIDDVENTQKKMCETLEAISQHLNKIDDEMLNANIDNYRWAILTFAQDLATNSASADQFTHIFNVHERYEKILEENGMKNGITDEAMKFIRDKYQESLRG